jgi:uncharacterized protein (TIGR02271 family)
VAIRSTSPEQSTGRQPDIAGSDQGAKEGKSGGAARARGTGDDTKLQLLAEEASFSKETLETGRVRISKRTHERDELIDENLARDNLEIETIPMNLRIDVAPEVRQEGDAIIVPVVEEVLFVERRLMLKEEIRIKRVRTTEHYQDRVTLRHQEAVITRIHGSAEQADIVSANDKKPTNVEE